MVPSASSMFRELGCAAMLTKQTHVELPRCPHSILHCASSKATMSNTKPGSSWVLLAIISGACAACNGVFAKLYADLGLLLYTI